MSQRGAALEKLGAPRWSWAMHNVLLANKVQQRQVPHSSRLQVLEEVADVLQSNARRAFNTPSTLGSACTVSKYDKMGVSENTDPSIIP